MPDLTPREIVAELDRHIVGQEAAKRAVAVAIRNRWRRQRLPEEMRPEVAPKNIMMIGPTGVGKTEIARRTGQANRCPVHQGGGNPLHGGGVLRAQRGKHDPGAGRKFYRAGSAEGEEERRGRGPAGAEERLVNLLAPRPPAFDAGSEAPATPERYERTREKMRSMLAAKELENRRVEIVTEQRAVPMMLAGPGLEQMDIDLGSMFEKIMPKHTSRRELPVSEAREVLFEQECDALINNEKVQSEAINLAENLGIIFLDEIDKVVAGDGTHGPDVSRQGVQRDLLPIVEGTTVQTRYGWVKTDHVLFIAAGDFHRAKPSDLMPELQGRFPIRVELTDLTKEDFIRILTEPASSLTKQYRSLMDTEGVDVVFTPDAIARLAEYAYLVNQTAQNIGAPAVHDHGTSARRVEL